LVQRTVEILEPLRAGISVRIQNAVTVAAHQYRRNLVVTLIVQIHDERFSEISVSFIIMSCNLTLDSDGCLTNTLLVRAKTKRRMIGNRFAKKTNIYRL